MSYRSGEKIKQCPKAIAAACNDMADEYADTDFAKAADALDYLRLLLFNDPIKGMFTHSYGFNTLNCLDIQVITSSTKSYASVKVKSLSSNLLS